MSGEDVDKGNLLGGDITITARAYEPPAKLMEACLKEEELAAVGGGKR